MKWRYYRAQVFGNHFFQLGPADILLSTDCLVQFLVQLMFQPRRIDLKMNRIYGNKSILVVGNIDPWLDANNELPLIKDTIFCVFSDMNAAFIEQHRPDMILSPLVTSQFDVMDLAIKLDQINYEGCFRAICAPLPDPEIILAEVRFECPALDFDLIVVNPKQNLRSV